MTELESLALGALLHDIGKFQQRACWHENAGVKHEAWSLDFIDRHVPIAFQSCRDYVPVESPWSAKQQLVARADGLAAAYERDRRPKDEKGSAITEPLEAATERIALSKAEQERRISKLQQRIVAGENLYYPLKALSLHKAEVFPLRRSGNSLQQDYAALWDSFISDHQKLPTSSFAAYFDSLIALLHKYTWCIPSATYVDYPTISLFDHSRMTAALAVCLAPFAESGATERPEFLLIEGDLTGIQKFIYQPGFNGEELQEGLARRLRGRSFYVDLLLKTIADFLRERLGLLSVNVLWATGGHFLLLAPNTEEVAQQLREARQTINRFLLDEFAGAVNIIIADLAASREGMKDFGKLRDRLGRRTARLKQQSFHTYLDADCWLMPLRDSVCVDTGRDLTQEQIAISNVVQQKIRPREDDEELPLRPRSQNSLLFDVIGRSLTRVQTLQLRRKSDWQPGLTHYRAPQSVTEAERLTGAAENVLLEFSALNRCWLLSSEIQPVSAADLCLRLADDRNAQIEFIPAGAASGLCAVGFELYAGYVPTRQGEIVRFGELARLPKENGAAEFLGVLRMDVDNLGLIFAKGYAEGERPISKIANLSRMLEWFFSGYLNSLLQGRNVYTTYAGGDDLFLIGAWDDVLATAAAIQQEFSAFCGQHQELHLSGAITLCKAKYPTGLAAQETGEKLDAVAKAEDKNALAFLERRIAWSEWPQVQQFGDELLQAVKDNIVSRKFVYSLIELYRNHIDPHRDPAQPNKPEEKIWQARLHYSVVRNVKAKTDEDTRRWRHKLVADIPRLKNHLSVIGGYVSLRTRHLQTETSTQQH
ncbi:MAG TPA: type III-A CRISPR-associated protein Cas10/Csm1 [Blastocatellia bacterium]|nr:type III-A CRISPR-associated protein Cas10/Csm1 [Blastocatellia bacterium]